MDPIKHAAVSVKLYANGGEVDIDLTDGYVGRLAEGSALMSVTVPSDRRVWVFMPDRQRDLEQKRDEATKLNHNVPEGEARYELRVGLKRSTNRRWNGAIYAEYPANMLLLIEDHGDGRFSIGHVALVSQQGNFFLKGEWYSTCEVFRDDAGIISCPRYDGTDHHAWTQLASVIMDMFKGDPASLRSLMEYEPLPQPDADGLAHNQGRVVFFNVPAGTGVIMTTLGVARIHWSDCPANPRYRSVKAGDIVEITKLQDAENTRTGRETAHRYDAKGLTLAVAHS